MRNNDYLATQLGIGKETLHRYVRLTYLIPELLKMVDEGNISVTPAVELSDYYGVRSPLNTAK